MARLLMNMSWLTWLTKKYDVFFAVDEIRQSKRLQAVFLASWFICFFDLEKRSTYPGIKNHEICWAFFENCKHYFPFETLPNSYNYMIWNGLILTLLFAAVWAAIQVRWSLAHFFLGLVLIWKFCLNFIFINSHQTNFELLHLIPSFILLFSKNKLFSLRITWALACLFAARVKLNEGWILGSYFTSLRLGLPLIPKPLIPIVTNAVILGEIILSYGLIAKNDRVRKISLSTWLGFHLYSATFVGFYYPVRCLLFLGTIFAFPQNDSSFAKSESKRMSLRSWVAIGLIVFINFLPSVVSKDPNLSTEGLDYGFFMINSNYQCLSSVTTLNSSGAAIKNWKSGSTAAMNRCFVIDTFQAIKRQCAQLGPGQKITWSFLQSQNGGPFYEIISEPDACALTFNAFAPNSWIRTPTEQLIRGYPEKNSALSVNQIPEIKSLPFELNSNSVLKDHYNLLLLFYKVVWGFIFFLMICAGIKIKLPLSRIIKK